MTEAQYRTLLRTLYTSILTSRLSVEDLRDLSQELRRGRLADELAYMLDQASGHFGGLQQQADDDRLVEAEQFVRRNRISKSNLVNVLESLDFNTNNNKESMREMLKRFIDQAPVSRTIKLLDVLKSMQTGDDYLVGIGKRGR